MFTTTGGFELLAALTGLVVNFLVSCSGAGVYTKELFALKA